MIDRRYIIVALSAILIFGGLYLKFLYDVPDAQYMTNRLTSWALVVLGIIGIMIGLLWKSRNPLQFFEKTTASSLSSSPPPSSATTTATDEEKRSRASGGGGRQQQPSIQDGNSQHYFDNTRTKNKGNRVTDEGNNNSRGDSAA